MRKTLCVIGASGLVGSHIVKAALGKGYRVNGTMRNLNDLESTSYLKKLKNSDNLTLFSADMRNTNDLDKPLSLDRRSFYYLTIHSSPHILAVLLQCANLHAR